MLLELAVQFGPATSGDHLRNLLDKERDVKCIELNESEDRLVVDSTLPVSTLLNLIRSQGFPALFRGASSDADGMKACDFGSGVAVLSEGGKVCGICRLFQPSDEVLLVDASADGLFPEHRILMAIHSFGDISNDAVSCGEILPTNEGTAQLGTVQADSDGHASWLVENTTLKLWNLIGRSVVLHDLTTCSRIACGIIARSANIFSNPKKVCACSGRTMWEEHAANPVG
uniref:Copper chaperone for superoxide dismutase n=1 Tax=Clonorchis sinensis TaxID=79923 RepID=A0A2Z5W9U7_CLOSI|nr:copper chaperone for superoxide dismutase [Clonorchis sinensis]